MIGPIFAREWLTLPRRARHYFTRGAYFGALWILVLTAWQTIVGWEQPATLGDFARFGLLAFQVLCTLELVLLLFFSALVGVGTVATEKDRRTFLLLLLTDMRNYEIVVGKLLGSLLQIGVLLLGSVPIFCLLALLGGVSFEQVRDAALILATASLAAGSLGILIALWRDKTFQALALTLLALVFYLCAVHGLSLLALAGVDSQWIAVAQTCLEPFVALQQVMDPPSGDAAAHWGGLTAAQAFALTMLGLSALLNGAGIAFLRVWNPSGEPIMQRDAADAPEAEPTRTAHAAPGKVRPVWQNPILWREIATRAYGRRPLLVKTAYFLVVGLIAYYVLAVMPPRPWAAAYGLVPIGILSLLLMTAQAVTAITSERDLGALDLLMVTDVSPREFIFGKLLGILYNTKEFVLPPLILIAVYAARGQLAAPPRSHYAELLTERNLSAAVYLLSGVAILFAFTMIFGIHVALRTELSRLAIVNALGTIFFLSIGTMVCIYLILINGRFEYQWLSFSGFLFAGVGGLWWVLSGDRPSPALTLASWACPIGVFYAVTNLLIGKPGTGESSDPLIPFLVVGSAFSFTIAAMLVPLLSEFDIAIGRTSALGD